jgi:nitrate/nitrite transport system ATP-binding protein
VAFLELRGVSKGYGPPANRTHVLHDINLKVDEGEFVAIVGYSGAGKTTLISLIAGLLSPDAGTMMLDGKPITGPGPDRGVVFQTYALLPWMTAFENIYLAVEPLFPALTVAQKRAHAQRYLEMVNLGPARDKRPSELSGGMRQRVSLARALAMNPRILLMDEPLSALDALTRATLQGEIERIWAADENGPTTKKTVLLITNDVDEGILLADRIIPLSAGPAATFGQDIRVDIERPRDRKALNHDPRFARIRNQVIEYLLGPGGRKRSISPTATNTTSTTTMNTTTTTSTTSTAVAGVAA